EVFLRARGWTRVDPTALAVPGRLETGLEQGVAAGTLPLLLRPELEWLRELRYNWEALTHQWNLWVLGYNPERQRDLMQRFGLRPPPRRRGRPRLGPLRAARRFRRRPAALAARPPDAARSGAGRRACVLPQARGQRPRALAARGPARLLRARSARAAGRARAD